MPEKFGEIWRKVYECSCGTHLLAVATDYRETGDLVDITFAFFTFNPDRFSLWDRIKYAFRVIFKGEIWEDQFILTKASAEELMKDLQKILEEKGGMRNEM